MKLHALPIAWLLTALFLAACLDEDGGTDSDDPDPQSTTGVTHDFSYVVKGNSLLITRDQVWRRCQGDTLKADTLRARTDTIEFELEGNVWRQLKDSEPVGSAVVRWVRTFKRNGDANGLEGVWFKPEDSYRIESGDLDPSDKSQLDATVRYANLSLDYHEDRITITQDTYTEYIDVRNAAQFVDFWNGTSIPDLTPDSAIYDMELRIVDKYTVELRGRKNGETVKLTRYPNWDLTITSSNPGHEELRYFGEPMSCPNLQEPVWYRGFLDANRKGG